MAEGASNKDVIYVDVDDEITGIIDKARSSKHQIVALVLPKRSAVLQSIVNMKLLKRTADEAKKNIVLITSDEGLLPLAGNVGLHVARNLQSKPEIPRAPVVAAVSKAEAAQEAINMADEGDDVPVDKTKTLGELSGGAAADDAAIELDNSEDETNKPVADTKKGDKKEKKAKKNKNLLIPNFNRFRSWLLVGACFLVVFIILLYVALTALPRATITINTNSQSVASNLQITLSSTATSANTGADVIPAQTTQTQKTYTGTANTTGQQNNGQQATGTITVTNCGPSPATLAAGTGFATGNFTFISTQTVVVPTSNFKFGGQCKNDGTASVPVQAQNGGAGYNQQSDETYTIANNPQYLTATGSAMTGGTDQITQIVAQADITSAQSKINTDSSAVKSQLASDLQSQGLYPMPATFSASTPTPNPSASVGSPASTVTVTESITYTMYGAKQSDLQQLIATSVDSQISTKSQKILDYGLSSASFSAQNQSANSEVVTMQDNALVGFALDQATIKSRAAGQKPGSAEGTIHSYSGVTSVVVHLSPFWVTSIPKSTSKITVKIVNPKS